MEQIEPNRKRRNRKYRQQSLRFPVAIIFILLFLLPVVGEYYANGLFQNMDVTDVIIIGGGILVLFFLEWMESRLYPARLNFLIRLLFLVGRISAIVGIIIMDVTSASLPIIAIFFYSLYFHFGLVATALILVAGVGYLSVNPEYSDMFAFDQTIMIYIFFMMIFAGLIKREEHSHIRNVELYKELEQYAAHSTSLAKEEERNRISRDLHDSLGHHLVALNIKIQKAIAFRELDKKESDAALEQAQQTTLDAMKELRNTLKDLREIDDSFDFLADVKALVDGVRKNGINIELDIQGSDVGYSELVLVTLRQAVQEGLTNVEKHAQANMVKLSIVFGRKQARFTLVDDGIGFPPGSIDGTESFGLKGIRERVDLVGGKMDIRSKEKKGTTLLLILPKNGYA